MRLIAAVTTVVLLLGCAAETEPVVEAVEQKVEAAQAPDNKDTLFAKGYASKAVITCSSEQVAQQLRAMGKEAAPAFAEVHTEDDFRRAYSALSESPSAQEALKALRTAESACLRDATPTSEQSVRSAAAIYRTEMELIPD